MTFVILCWWYRVFSSSNPGIITARDVQNVHKLQWMSINTSICTASVNSLWLQKTLIMYWPSNKIQVRGTPTLVMLKALLLRPELTSRCPSWHILNPILNPRKLAILVVENRFPDLCVYFIIRWFYWCSSDMATWSSWVLVFSSVWEVLQGVTVASPGSLVDCGCYKLGNSQKCVLVSRIHSSSVYRGIGLGIQIFLPCPPPLQRWNGVVHYCLQPSCGS